MALRPKATSNKTQTLIKKTWPPKPPQSDLKPFIDKLTVVIKPADEAFAHNMHAAIWTALNDKDVFQSLGTGKNGWDRVQLIALDYTAYRPYFSYKYGKGAHGENVALRARLEFNPRKLGPDGLMALHSVLNSMWEGGWNYVVNHGRITKIDVAVDVPGARMDDFHCVPHQGASQTLIGRDGHLQTLYHGKSKGNQTAIYSVKAKRKAKKQKWDGSSVVRIERRLRNPSPYKITDLKDLKNPFAGMAFAMMPGPPPLGLGAGKEWMWSMFQDSVTVRGCAAALALLPTLRKTQYRNHLKKFPKPWWNPDAIWKNWPTAFPWLQKLY